MTAIELTFHVVDADRWGDFEALFESRGGPHNCWCMAWRPIAASIRGTPGPQRKAAFKQAMRKRVSEHTPIGILGYAGDEPVAWCSVAPRPTYRPLGGLKQDAGDPAVWSIACFFVKRRFREKGVTADLLQAAVAHARAEGARVIEAYPVDPASPSYGFMGHVGLFERAGFERVGAAGTRRHVMRLAIE